MDRGVIGERSDAVLRAAMPGDDSGVYGCVVASQQQQP